MNECSDEPQSAHVPHLRATDEEFPFACDATADPEAQSVPQVAHSAESQRVHDVSEGLAKLHRDQSGAQHADRNRTHLPWECGQA